jgi:hypothetical protein
LDDALDKLARRDELRRRTAGEATGTAPAVQELVESIVAVVGRNPKLEVTVGVEGVGDPVLLHFAVEDGTVQVNVDNSVASRVAEAAPSSPRHADFDLDVEEPVVYADEEFEASAYAPEAGQQTRRISYDDRERFGYSDVPQEPPVRAYGDPLGGDRRYEGHRRYDDELDSPDFFAPEPAGPFPAESRARYSTGAPDTDPRGGYSSSSSSSSSEGETRDLPYPPHPFAATPPPPVPPQTFPPAPVPRPAPASRPSHAEQYRAPEQYRGAAAAEPGRIPEQPVRSMPTPLPEPIPLNIDTEETEQAARRLAALLRDNPTLLRPAPRD